MALEDSLAPRVATFKQSLGVVVQLMASERKHISIPLTICTVWCP